MSVILQFIKYNSRILLSCNERTTSSKHSVLISLLNPTMSMVICGEDSKKGTILLTPSIPKLLPSKSNAPNDVLILNSPNNDAIFSSVRLQLSRPIVFKCVLFAIYTYRVIPMPGLKKGSVSSQSNTSTVSFASLSLVSIMSCLHSADICQYADQPLVDIAVVPHQFYCFCLTYDEVY